MKKKIILLLWATLLCGRIQAQTSYVHPWMQKRVAYFGDSITDPRNSGSKVKYWNFLQEWLGITPYVYAVSGRQWNDIPRQADKLREEHGDSVDAILIFIGTNDYNNGVPIGQWYEEKAEKVMYGHGQPKKLVNRKRRYMSMDANTYRGRINIALDKVKRMYPHQADCLAHPPSIVLSSIVMRRTGSVRKTTTNQCGIYLEEYIDAVKEAGNIWALPVIDMNALSGLYPMMDEHAQYFADPQVDRLHPNDKGHERI